MADTKEALPVTDQELQSLRNLGNESERAAAEICQLRADLTESKRDNWGAQGIRMRDYRIECQRMELRRLQQENATATEALSELRAEVERYKADAERLDWLEAQGCIEIESETFLMDDRPDQVNLTDGFNTIASGKDLRAAIDAARAGASGGTIENKPSQPNESNPAQP